MTEDTNFLDTQQAAGLLGLSAKTLARYRSASDRDQKFVARRGRRIGGVRRDCAGVFNETNTDGAARDLDAAKRSGGRSV